MSSAAQPKGRWVTTALPSRKYLMMNRRNFLAGISALVGGLAVNEAIPFGRVWSFPSKIVVPQTLYFHPDAFALAFQDGAAAFSRAPRGEVGTLYGFHLPT